VQVFGLKLEDSTIRCDKYLLKTQSFDTIEINAKNYRQCARIHIEILHAIHRFFLFFRKMK